MNCKPGDLAITFGAPDDNGLLVRVGEPIGIQPDRLNPSLGPYWGITSLGSPFHLDEHRRSHRVFWPDKWLKPIRDPGPDANDEMLRPLPKRMEAA